MALCGETATIRVSGRLFSKHVSPSAARCIVSVPAQDCCFCLDRPAYFGLPREATTGIRARTKVERQRALEADVGKRQNAEFKLLLHWAECRQATAYEEKGMSRVASIIALSLSCIASIWHPYNKASKCQEATMKILLRRRPPTMEKKHAACIFPPPRAFRR